MFADSTPREVGAKMIVREDGQFGTIGGGCGEAEVFRKARVLLEEGDAPRLAEVDLTGDFDQRKSEPAAESWMSSSTCGRRRPI